MSSKCVSFYILHVNKCGFLVCRPANAETIPTSISQQDKLKLNQAQPPHLHHLSHLYHPSSPCTPSLLVHHLSHCHHSSPACTLSLLVHFLSLGQALPSHVQYTKLACTSHPAQVHHTSIACITLPHLFHHPSPACTTLPHLLHHPSLACTALVQVHTRPPQDHPIQLHHPT